VSQEAQQLLRLSSRHCLCHVAASDDLVKQLAAITTFHDKVEAASILQDLL
jgi:hypothetical protein